MELEEFIDVRNMEHTHEPTKEELKARKHCMQRRAHEAEHKKVMETRASVRREKLEVEAARLEELFHKRKMRERFEAAQRAEEEIVEAEYGEHTRRTERDNADIKILLHFLREHGFHEVNERNVDLHGWRYPLHVAVGEADATVVRLLLEAGAKPNVRSTSGSTPLDKAKKSGDAEIIAILQEAVTKEVQP